MSTITSSGRSCVSQPVGPTPVSAHPVSHTDRRECSHLTDGHPSPMCEGIRDDHTPVRHVQRAPNARVTGGKPTLHLGHRGVVIRLLHIAALGVPVLIVISTGFQLPNQAHQIKGSSWRIQAAALSLILARESFKQSPRRLSCPPQASNERPFPHQTNRALSEPRRAMEAGTP